LRQIVTFSSFVSLFYHLLARLTMWRRVAVPPAASRPKIARA
jgi:hypothetical protein